MNWNMSLAVLSVVLLFFWAAAGFVEPFAMAESLAEKLAPRIGVDESALRAQLVILLRETAFYRTAVRCTPLALVSLLLIFRVLFDTGRFGRESRQHSCDRAVDN